MLFLSDLHSYRDKLMLPITVLHVCVLIFLAALMD